MPEEMRKILAYSLYHFVSIVDGCELYVSSGERDAQKIELKRSSPRITHSFRKILTHAKLESLKLYLIVSIVVLCGIASPKAFMSQSICFFFCFNVLILHEWCARCAWKKDFSLNNGNVKTMRKLKLKNRLNCADP